MFEPNEDERDVIYRDLKALVGWSFWIDMGERWQDWERLVDFEVDDPEATEVSLPHGSTDHPGFELLPREAIHVVLKGLAGDPPKRRGERPAARLVAQVVAQAAFEPVPVETVLWDGRTSSFSSAVMARRQTVEPPDADEPIFVPKTSGPGPAKSKTPKKKPGGKKKK